MRCRGKGGVGKEREQITSNQTTMIKAIEMITIREGGESAGWEGGGGREGEEEEKDFRRKTLLLV